MSTTSIKSTAAWLVMVLLLMQFIPLDRINPPEPSPVMAPDAVISVLKKSCFDCHSFRTKWPLQAYIAPVSWATSSTVHRGRKAMNFSEWGNSNHADFINRIQAIRKTVLEGSKHEPLYYTCNPQSRLSAAESTILLNWIDTSHRKRFMGFKNSGNSLRDKNL